VTAQIVNLRDLLFDCDSNEDAEIERRCRAEYEAIVERAKTGVVLTHDGTTVRVFSDNFEHAFRTSSDWYAQKYAKDKLDKERVVRVRWIEPVVAGAVRRSACWSVRDVDRRRPNRRLYLVWDENYVVWLQPTNDGSWKFSTAYRARDYEIRKYTDNGTKIWRREG
jgi:hypothetical protein